jgi:thioredoxin 1
MKRIYSLINSSAITAFLLIGLSTAAPAMGRVEETASQRSSSVQEIGTANFESLVLNAPADTLVVVKFYNPGCPPCKALAAPFAQAATTYASESTQFYAVNASTNIPLIRQYNIMSVPVVIFFRNGKVVQRLAGSKARENLVATINALLAQ